MAGPGYLPVKILDNDDDIRQHYVRHRNLGAGLFGETFEVTDVNDPSKLYAMKVQSKTRWSSRNPQKELLRLFKELLILDKIVPKHPNIIELEDILVGPEKVFIVQELCHGPTLDGFFHTADDLSGRRAFKQLAEAVHTLHEHGVVHGDIKPDNVLFKDRAFMELKLIDFGISTYRPDWPDRVVKRHNDFDYTNWLLPEELELTSIPVSSDDVQALGLTLFSIIAGRHVPGFLSSDGHAWFQMQANFRPRTERFSPAAMNLLMLIGPSPLGPEEPDLLLKSAEICQHPWLTGLPAIAFQPAEQDQNLRAEFAQLQNDLTVLLRLLKEWMIIPLKHIVSERQMFNYYGLQSRIRTSAAETAVIKVKDLFYHTRTYAIKVIYGRVKGKPEFVLEGHATRPPLSMYMELLIILRILPRHPNIVALKSVLVNPEYVAIVREFLEGSSLEDFFAIANEDNSRTVFKQLADTVHFLHLHGVVHMDLHPHHILFTDGLFAQCEIVNFSRAVFIQQMAINRHENFEATRYLTPELLQLPPQANVQVDLTALGRILHAMMMAGQWEPDPARCANLAPRNFIFGDAASDLLSRIGPEPFGPGPNNRACDMEEICGHPWVVRAD